MNINSTIFEYEQFCEWINTLHQISDKDWHSPIKEGKASIAEIIAHLRNWDLHLINVVIPLIIKGKGMEFPTSTLIIPKPMNMQIRVYRKSNSSKNSQEIERD
jgi:hypothetical protein